MVAENGDGSGSRLVSVALGILMANLEHDGANVSTHKCDDEDKRQTGTVIVAGPEWSPLFRGLTDTLARLDAKGIDTHDFLSHLVAAIDAVSRGDEPRASFQFKMKDA